MIEFEKKCLWDRHWHLIGHRSELANDKDYLLFRVFDEEVAVWNDSGSLVAFDNLCPHRGTAILEKPYGNAPLICPYHGWMYRRGELRIPRREEYSAEELAG